MTQPNIFIVNGISNSGKKTFIQYIQNEVPKVYAYNYIKPVEEIAKQMGWISGDNSEKGRILLGRLERTWGDYNNRLLDQCVNKVQSNNFMYSKPNFHFIIARRPSIITILKHKLNAKTILITRNNIKAIEDELDLSIYNIKYDLFINNYGTLSEFYKEIDKFIGKYLNTFLRINKQLIKTKNGTIPRDSKGRFLKRSGNQ